MIKKFLEVNFIKNILLSTFLINIIFYKIPIEIYYFNRPEFHNYAIILIPTLIIFLLSLFFYKKILNNKTIFDTFLILSIYLILSKILIPLNIDELEGNLEKPIEMKYSIFIELFILAISIFLIKFFKKEYFLNFIAIFAFIIFVTSSYYYARSFASLIKNEYKYFGLFNKGSDYNFKKNNKPNIYILTFDAFSTFALKEVIKEQDLKSTLNDFEFYVNNSSNYSSTALSVPSFLTGTFYNFNTNLRDWRETYRNGGIISELIEKKYEVWQYVQSSSMQHQDVKLGTTNVELLLKKSKINLILELYDFLLLRISPQFLHQEIYNNGSGTISKIYKKFNNSNETVIPGEHFRALGSKLLFLKMIEEERLRSQKGSFVHAHIYIPHGPYVLDEKAEYDPSPYDGITGKIKYIKQAKGTVYLINEFLKKLKEQKKFKESLIIINADHGSWEIGLDNLPDQYLSREKSLSDNLRQLPAHYIFNQSQSLLMIKKPNKYENEKLIINKAKTQLMDIYATIKEFSEGKKLNLPKNGMISLLDDNIPDDRVTKFFVGYKQRESPKHQWTTIEKQKGGYLDLFEISNNNFIVKKDRLYAIWK